MSRTRIELALIGTLGVILALAAAGSLMRTFYWMRGPNRVVAKLELPVNLEKPIEQRPLSEILVFFGDRFDLSFDLNSEFISRDNYVDLPSITAVNLSIVLQVLADQVGGVFLVSKDGLLLVSSRDAQIRLRGGNYQAMPSARLNPQPELGALLASKIAIPNGISGRLTKALEKIALAAEELPGPDVNILIRYDLFRAKQMPDIGSRRVKLPAAHEIRIDEALRLLLKGANATYRVEGNVIWIVPE